MSNHFSQAQALYFEGNRLLALNDLLGAQQSYFAAFALDPHLAEAAANLGYVAERLGDIEQAETYYLSALELLPENVQLLLNLGAMYLNQRRLSDAENLLRHALMLAPQVASAWLNWGALQACLQHDEQAESSYRTALQIEPENAKAKFNLSYILLRQGRMEEAWPYYEAREQIQHLTRFFVAPRWQGETLQGKSIIVGFEAGHGDMIQFCRYVPLLKQRGARHVAVVCHPGLKRLFQSLMDVDEIFSFHDDVSASDWDYWVPMMSLPLHFHTTLDTIPTHIPYLAAEPTLIEQWRPIIARAGEGMRVGIVWQGNSRFESDNERSLASLAVFAPLASVPRLTLISLQKGSVETQADHPPAGMSVFPVYKFIDNFADTAAAIMHLDLVISVDTAVAHLAGSLGKPCWLLLRHYRADWRWLTERVDSPWYPSLRLFRQTENESWEDVIQVVRDILCDQLSD